MTDETVIGIKYAGIGYGMCGIGGKDLFQAAAERNVLCTLDFGVYACGSGFLLSCKDQYLEC